MTTPAQPTRSVSRIGSPHHPSPARRWRGSASRMGLAPEQPADGGLRCREGEQPKHSFPPRTQSRLYAETGLSRSARRRSPGFSTAPRQRTIVRTAIKISDRVTVPKLPPTGKKVPGIDWGPAQDRRHPAQGREGPSGGTRCPEQEGGPPTALRCCGSQLCDLARPSLYGRVLTDRWTQGPGSPQASGRGRGHC